jgi:steroid 5-alpha reductase family enzyme
MTQKIGDIEAAARISQRQLLGGLAALLLIGTAALFGLGEARWGLWALLPVLLAVLAAALRREGSRIDPQALDAVRHDELRQASTGKAWRNGFFALLMLQPLLALWLAGSDYASGTAVAIMAGASAVTGAAVMLATLLWHDR